MPGFNQNFTPLTSRTLGFRDDAVGALSSNWTLVTGVTPGDIGVISVTVNVVNQPTTSITSPMVYNNVKRVTNPGYWRATAVCRADANKAGRMLFGTLIKTPQSIAGWDICAEFNQNANKIRINRGNNPAVGFDFTIVTNVWYRLGIECFNGNVSLYFNTSSGADPTAAPGMETASLILQATLPAATGELYPCIIFGGSQGANSSALGEFIFEELKPPVITSGGGGISASNSGTYTRYKSIRAARMMLNDLTFTS